MSSNIKQFLSETELDPYRPVHKGDTFICIGGFKSVEFKVVETDPEKWQAKPKAI